MDSNPNEFQRPVNPRRKKKTKVQIFKETYLPFIIAGVAALLILIFIIGAIVRAVQSSNEEEQAQQEVLTQEQLEHQRLLEEEAALMAEAQLLADVFDYEGAIQVLNRFSGEFSDFPLIGGALEEYIDIKNQLVAWDDPNDVINLSFQLLVSDPDRTFRNHANSSLFNRSFVTVDEFSQILQQLYDNGYILVSADDLFEFSTDVDGTSICTAKTLYLPAGRKPIMLTQTNVNYNYYLIDSDNDKIPDANGGGFGTRLVLEGDQLLCETLDSNGHTQTGAYDMIPILEEFISVNPDFAYKNARATIALTGYNGLFGYRTEPTAKDRIGDMAYDEAIYSAEAIANWLRNHGYELAFYTYDNIAYGDCGVSVIRADLQRWQDEVEPIIGHVNTIVYAQNSDITSEIFYSGEKYNLLKEYGFQYYVGFCTEGAPWANVAAEYVRQGRILVSGSSLAYHADWFSSMFDATLILDPSRGVVPQ